MPEHQQTQKYTESKTTSQKQATLRIQAPVSHPMAIIQRARINPKSLTHADVMQLQQTIGNRAVVRLLTEIGAIPSKAKQASPVQRQELVQRQEIPEEEEPLQGKFENTPEIACPSCFAAPIVQRQEIPEEEEPLQGKMIGTVQRQEIPEEEEPLQTKRENNTGMPDNLKAGVESLSGIDMSDVRVNYNSSKPAEVGALAYTQGTNIHIAPGQERHLPHEAWHVVQQAQGRVKPTVQMRDGVPVNNEEGLEQEADVMGARDWGLLSHTLWPRVDRPGTNTSVPPIQGVWRFFDGLGTNKFVFWSDEGDGPKPDSPVPSVWSTLPQQSPAPCSFFLVGKQRPLHGRMPALTLPQWTVQYGGSQRAPSDVFYYFGRFDSSATVVSFVPSPQMPAERINSLLERLAQSDKAFQPCDVDETCKFVALLAKENPDEKVVTSDNYPVRIITTSGVVLYFVSSTEFGATYCDVLPSNAYAMPSPSKIDDPSKLHWAEGVPTAPEYMEAKNYFIDKDTIDSWHGKDRELQQSQVMGISAADAAANAGFDRNEGKGWEWLHLIAHSMGGIEVDGPQVAQNLVAGTSECNTQMIVVEEFLKDIVQKTDGRAQLHVLARMFDPQRHIGDFIVYDFLICDKLGQPIAVYHWIFECLSRRNPVVAQNRQLRHAGREVFGVGDKLSGSVGYRFGEPSPFGPVSPSLEPKVGGLSIMNMKAAVLSIPDSRRSQIALMLGSDASLNTPEQIIKLLMGQPSEVVLDIVRGGSVGVPKDDQVQRRVDTELEDYGMRRQPSDTIGFICLIDSIHQLLLGAGISVPRDKLIQAVHDETGRHMGDMLEIIGVEGIAVMRAVESVIFATLQRHVSLLAHVYMVMPDGTIVPFFRANQFRTNGYQEIDLDLLFVNNNHYEPLFYN